MVQHNSKKNGTSYENLVLVLQLLYITTLKYQNPKVVGWKREVMEFHFLTKAFFSGALVGVLGLVFHLYNTLVAKPETLRSALKRQGVSGPRPTLLLGNILEIKKARDSAAKASTNGAPASHNCGATLLPFFDNWRKQYGMNSVWFYENLDF